MSLGIRSATIALLAVLAASVAGSWVGSTCSVGVPDHQHRSRRGGERAVAKTEQLTADTRGLVFALELRPGGCVVRRLPHRQHKRVPAQSVGARDASSAHVEVTVAGADSARIAAMS